MDIRFVVSGMPRPTPCTRKPPEYFATTVSAHQVTEQRPRARAAQGSLTIPQTLLRLAGIVSSSPSNRQTAYQRAYCRSHREAFVRARAPTVPGHRFVLDENSQISESDLNLPNDDIVTI